MAEQFPHVCQYWIEDEPTRCQYWDEESQLCTFEREVDVDPPLPYYPLCNRIGTQTLCDQYAKPEAEEGEEPIPDIEARCILPDPSRHVLDRETGAKWLKEQLACYNDGKCNSATEEGGTCTTCSGYSPYHLAFSKLKPSEDEELTGAVSVDELGYRLPHHFEVFNFRAKLSRCYWWKANSTDFSINTENYVP